MRYWPSLFVQDAAFGLFYVFMDRDEVGVNKNAKANEANIQPSWTNKFGQ